MLTNWNTIQNSIKRLKKLDEQLSKENLGFTKKEILKFGKEKEKLKRSLGGIAEMKKTPDLIFIIDTNSDGWKDWNLEASSFVVLAVREG